MLVECTAGSTALGEDEKQPSLLHQVSVAPVQSEDDDEQSSNSSDGEISDDRHLTKSDNLASSVLSNWHDLGTVIAIDMNEQSAERRIANASRVIPNCQNGHKMIISDYSKDGYQTGYICDKCRGASRRGHNGGTREVVLSNVSFHFVFFACRR